MKINFDLMELENIHGEKKLVEDILKLKMEIEKNKKSNL
jgi:hypothetical protein